MSRPDSPPFLIRKPLAPIVEELKRWLSEKRRLHSLHEAVQQAYEQNISHMKDWRINSGERFLEYASGMVNWIPDENVGGREIYWVLCLFYFVFDQPAINDLQTPIDPSQIGKQLTYLSQWVVKYSQNIGSFLSTPASITTDSYQTFVNSPRFNLDEALVPPGGFQTFNELFARSLKPGVRPISRPDDDKVIVYPADSTLDGAWDVSKDGTVSIKGLDWPFSALLEDSHYADKFNNGKWMHAFLDPSDYHRQHAPVSGTVVEAKNIQGLAYLHVDVVKDSDGNNVLKPHRSFRRTGPGGENGPGDELDAPDEAGYQFLQTRGCITIKNKTLGYVSVLPVGMAQVSSVKVHVKVHDEVKKGQEISHFEFGGSDVILVFQASAGVEIFGAQGQKYLVGQVLGYARPD